MSVVKETLEAPKTSKPEAERRDCPVLLRNPRAAPGDGMTGKPPAARPWSPFVSAPPWAAFAPPPPIQPAPTPHIQRKAAATAAATSARNVPARQADAAAAGKSGCACGTPGAASDPCPACLKVLAAASGMAAVPPRDGVDGPMAALTTALFGRQVPVSQPDDAAEREADRIAAARPPARGAISLATPTPRQESSAREVPVLARGGEPLPAAVRSHYEPQFGRSLADVRVHTGSTAALYAGALGAQAFTYGNHIWMGAGRSVHPSLLLAHELTHVLQQSGGGQWQIARKPDDPASKDDPDRNIPLGALDDERFDTIARAALGDVQWTVFREFIRGAAGGLLSTSPAQAAAIMAKFRGMSLGETFDFIKGFGPGIVDGFWSSLKGLFEALFTLVKLPFEIGRFLVETAPTLAIKFGERLAKLAAEGDSIAAELGSALRQFLANPAAAARQLDALLSQLKDFALAKVRGLGRSAVEKLISFLAQPPRAFGHDVGVLTGMVLFEVLLAVGTSGIGNVVAKVTSVAGRVAARAFASTVEMFSTVRTAVTAVLDAVSKLGGRLTGKMGELLERLMRVLRRLLGELDEMLAAPGVTPEGVRVPVPKGPTIVESRAVKPPAGGGRAGTRVEDLRPKEPMEAPPRGSRPAQETPRTEPEAQGGKGEAKSAARPTRPSYKLGDSDGGPGVWSEEGKLGGKKKTAEKAGDFQRKVTGAPEGVEYIVKGPNPEGVVKFDGYDPARNVLLDGKRFERFPLISSKGQLIGEANVLEEARRQVNAFRNGTRIEWHVATEEKAKVIRRLLSADARFRVIEIVWPPMFLGGG
jgi:hypothetical protein